MQISFILYSVKFSENNNLNNRVEKLNKFVRAKKISTKKKTIKKSLKALKAKNNAKDITKRKKKHVRLTNK